MNTLHKQIYKALLPSLLEITRNTRYRLVPELANARIKKSSKEDEQVARKIKDYAELLRSQGNISVEYLEFVGKMLGLALGNIPLATMHLTGSNNNSGAYPTYDPLTVIVFTKKNSDLTMIDKDVPYIVTHGKNKKVLEVNGTEYGAYHYHAPGHRNEDKIEIATDQQVKDCLRNLSVAQIKTILTSDKFFAALSPMFETKEEIEEETLETVNTSTEIKDTNGDPVGVDTSPRT